MASQYFDRVSNTIAAPITAPARSGVAVIRVSGDAALQSVKAIAPFLPQTPESHKVYYGFLEEKSTTLDEVLLTYFEAARSFTGEPSVEISCHGNPIIVAQILAALSKQKVLAALPGEFSFRAFSNGRIDLVQAESIMSLVHGRTPDISRLSLRQLRGELSGAVAQIEDNITWILANIEASIDFTTEDIDVLEVEAIKKRTAIVKEAINKITKSFEDTKYFREGLQVALVGHPNAGKSSLLNALLKEEKAIVTEVPGTTRDLIEGEIKVKAGIIRFVDTAGIRETEDRVEKLGVELAYSAIEKADVVLHLLDITAPAHELELKTKGKKTIRVGTKADLAKASDSNKYDICVSSKTGQGIEALENQLEEILSSNLPGEDAVLLQQRHYELLTAAREKTTKALENLHAGDSLELIALDLRESLEAIYEMLGKKYDDQVMDRVFKEFCIGK